MFSTDTLLKQTVKRATVPWRTRQHGRAAPFFKQTQRQEKAPSGVGALRCDFSRLRRTIMSVVLGMSITVHMSSNAEARRARVSVLVNIRLSTILLGGREAKRLMGVMGFRRREALLDSLLCDDIGIGIRDGIVLQQVILLVHRLDLDPDGVWLGEENPQGALGYRLGGRDVEDAAHDPADHGEHVDQVDRATLAELGEEAEAHALVDLHERLPGELLDCVDEHLLADVLPHLLGDVRHDVAGEGHVAERLHLVGVDVVAAHVRDCGYHAQLHVEDAGEVRRYGHGHSDEAAKPRHEAGRPALGHLPAHEVARRPPPRAMPTDVVVGELVNGLTDLRDALDHRAVHGVERLRCPLLRKRRLPLFVVLLTHGETP